MKKLELGWKYKDKVTGFIGVATARIEYLTGCAQLNLQPEYDAKKGVQPDPAWFDESRLERQGKAPVMQPITASDDEVKKGGPGPSHLPFDRSGRRA